MPVAKVEVELPYILQIFNVTEEMFWKITDEDAKCDLIDGVLYIHSPASRRHERLFMFLASLMKAYADELGLGEMLGSRMTMDISPLRKFEPDIMFIKSENLERLKEKAFQGPADMVVEIISESTRHFDLTVKRDAYGDRGRN
jgi:Uma2 family endonuclease